mgnify:FL=1
MGPKNDTAGMPEKEFPITTQKILESSTYFFKDKVYRNMKNTVEIPSGHKDSDKERYESKVFKCYRRNSWWQSFRPEGGVYCPSILVPKLHIPEIKISEFAFKLRKEVMLNKHTIQSIDAHIPQAKAPPLA